MENKNQTLIQILCNTCDRPIGYIQETDGKAMCSECEREIYITSFKRFQESQPQTVRDVYLEKENNKYQTMNILADLIIQKMTYRHHHRR